MTNLQCASQQGIGTGNRLMRVDTGTTVLTDTQDVGMQPVLDRRTTIPRNEHKVFQAQQDLTDLKARRVSLVPKETKAKEARRGLPVLPDPRGPSRSVAVST